MSATITAQDGTGDTSQPVEIRGWSTPSDSGNIVHDLIDGSNAVTVVGEKLRAGSFPLIYDTDADADAARQLLGRPTFYTIVDDERPVAVSMTFVRQGSMNPAMYDQNLDVWILTVGFQEIAT